MNTVTQTLISEALKTQQFTLREMGEALAVSHQAVAQWANGTMEPTEERIRSWLTDERQWVKQLGLHLFASRHSAELSAISASFQTPKSEQAA